MSRRKKLVPESLLLERLSPDFDNTLLEEDNLSLDNEGNLKKKEPVNVQRNSVV